MKIMHVSLPSDDPQKTAQVLAEIMQGEALRFPPGGNNAWKVFAGDGSIDLEVIERGNVILLAEGEGVFARDPEQRRHSECHVALCVERPEEEVIDIARRAGWEARHCERGGGLFGLAEVWVDNAFMIEVLDATQTARYRERINAANWKRVLAQLEARAS